MVIPGHQGMLDPFPGRSLALSLCGYIARWAMMISPSWGRAKPWGSYRLCGVSRILWGWPSPNPYSSWSLSHSCVLERRQELRVTAVTTGKLWLSPVPLNFQRLEAPTRTAYDFASGLTTTHYYESLKACCQIVSNSLQPHGLQYARLFCPWDSPGKNTGVGCHFLLWGIFLTQDSAEPPGSLTTTHYYTQL